MTTLSTVSRWFLLSQQICYRVYKKIVAVIFSGFVIACFKVGGKFAVKK